MQRLRMALVASASLVAAVSAAGAQMRVANPVPASMIPPVGMCRVWLTGVAPARQPAPTDCATARAQAPAGSRLVQGSQASSLRTGQGRGGFDPRRDPRRDPRADDHDRRDGGGWWDRTGRDRGDWDQMSDKERRKAQREYEKDQRKRNREWDKRQRSRDDDDSDSDSDDDDDDDHDRGDQRRGDVRRGGRYDPRSGRVRLPGRIGVPTRRPCIDTNRDGVCDWRP